MASAVTLPEAPQPEPASAEPAQALGYQGAPGTFAVIDPDGERTYVRAEDIEAAQAEGSRLATIDDIWATEPGAKFMAADAGLLRGMSFGLSDPLLVETGRFIEGDAGAEHMRSVLRGWKQHEGISTAGELAGSLSTLLVGMPPAAGAEVTASSLVGRAAQRVAAQAPRLIGEGVLMGEGQQLSEDTLGDHERVAENYVMAGLKGGAVSLFLGGTFAAGGGLVADGVKAGVGAAKAGASKLGRRLLGGADDAAAASAPKALGTGTAKDIESLAERKFGHAADGLGERVRDAYAKGAAGISGKDQGAIRSLIGSGKEAAEARRLVVFDADKEFEATAKAFRSSGDDMLRGGELVAEEFKGALKANKVGALVKRGNEGEVVAYARSRVGEVLQTIENELTHQNGVAKAVVRDLEDISRSAYKALADVEEAAAKGGRVNETAFMALDTLKRDMQAFTAGGYRRAQTLASSMEARNFKRTVEVMDRAQEATRKGLEDVGLWGRAGEVQEAINSAWSKQIGASRRFHAALTTEIGRDPTNHFLKIKGIDPGKADAYARNLVNPHADLTHAAVKDYVESTEALAKTIRDHVDLPPQKVAQVTRIEKAAQQFRQAVLKGEKTLTLVNQYKQLTSAADGFPALAGILGFSAGGVFGGVAGAAAGSLANPHRVIAQMAALERMGAKLDDKLGGAVRAFLSGTKKAAPAAEKAAQSTDDLVRSIRSTARTPALLSERIAEHVRDVNEAAPKAAGAAAVTLTRAATYLAQNLPKEPQPRGPAFLPGKPPPMSVTDRETAERMIRGALEPEKVLDAIASGRVSREEIAAFRHVFPKRFEQIRAEIVKQAREIEPELTVQQEATLAVLFDAPIGQLTEPETMLGFQEAFASPATNAASQDPTTAPSAGGAVPAPRYRSEWERIEGGLE
jgi:hypothetical protein